MPNSFGADWEEVKSVERGGEMGTGNAAAGECKRGEA